MAVLRSFDGQTCKVDLDIAAAQSKFMQNFNENIFVSDTNSQFSQMSKTPDNVTEVLINLDTGK